MTTPSHTLKGNRRIVWAALMTLAVLGFIAAALVMPNRSEAPAAVPSGIQVPRMQNVPPEARKIELEVEAR